MIVFFVVIILSFYAFMYSSVKDNIRLRGEKTALESAEKFDRYMSTSSHLVNLEKKMLDQMLLDGASSEEIQNYMVQETKRIQETVDSGYTGLYGYILDEYHDGANWVPGDDFVPTERPWYINAMDDIGELTVAQPYVDAQTDLLVTTLSITLNDGKSVLALDISFDMIQTVTKEMKEGSKQPLQIIIDDDGYVVAHSYAEEIGRNYYKESGTLGSEIIEHLYKGQDGSFEIRRDGKNYMIYTIPISNGWYSISVIDSTESYRPLNVMVIVILLILIITVIILNIVFINSSAKSIRAEKLNHQLAMTAKVYMSVCDIDIINDTADEIKSSVAPVQNHINDKSVGAQEIFYRIFENIPNSSSREMMKDFVNFKKLQEILAEKDVVTAEYLSFGNIWCRARFIVSERTADGRLSHVLWSVENIDEEKRKREELIDISERAVAANEAKSAFLSNMSHEIRTPINAVLGLNEMILRECHDEDILSYSSSIDTAGRTLLGLVNDILDFSKIEAGKLEIIPVDYSLSSMLNDLAIMIHTKADEKNLQIIIKVDKCIPEQLHGDEIRIKQIITNILTNAVKYTEKGSITFNVGYEKMDSDKIRLKVSVKDTGIGIKKEDMSKLFSEFDRIEEKRNRNIEGTGLGMSITNSLLGMMGSSLHVDSEYGKGSEFSFEIVQDVVDWTQIGDYENTYKENVLKEHDYKEKFVAPSAQVLVVDDTPLNLTVFTSLLKKTQLQIFTEDRGDKAIKTACSKKFDIIFLDHMMPEKDGIETLKELMEREDNCNKDTPVICLTANAISGAREKYISAGFDDYLTKPIDSDKLEEMLIKYLPEDKLERRQESNDNEPADITLPAFIYDIKEIDVETAVAHCGSARIYLDILHAFADMIGECVDDAQEYLSKNDLGNVEVKIHAIKSELRTIGAYKLGEFAEGLERAAKEGNVSELNSKAGALFKRTRELESRFAALRSEEITNDESLPVITEDELHDIYKRISESAEDFDYDTADELIRSLKNYHIREEHLATVKKLLHISENVDYDQISSVVGKL